MKKLLAIFVIALFTLAAKGQASLHLVEEYSTGAFKLQVNCMPAPQGMYRTITWYKTNGWQVWETPEISKTFTSPGKYRARVNYGTWAPGTGWHTTFTHHTNIFTYGGSTLYMYPQTPSVLQSRRKG